MGLFDGYSTPVDQIPTGYGLAASAVPYAVVLTDVKNIVKKKNGQTATVLTFTVDTAADRNGRKGKEDIFIDHPQDGDDNADVQAKNAKVWTSVHLGIPQSVYAVEGFDIPQVKDKLIGNVRGHLLITQGENPGWTNKKFSRLAPNAGEHGPATVEPPKPKEEEPMDFAKLLAEQDTNSNW